MVYTGEHLKEISFPLGGLGTGSIGLAGNGALVDWEIFNRPNKGSINPYSGFAVRAEFPDGRSVTRILQGDLQQALYKANEAALCGVPHFRKVSFNGQFPITTLTFSDPDFPGKVVMKAFNPFIPLDAENSGIPAAFFDICIHCPEDGIRYSVALSARNPFGDTVNSRLPDQRFTAVTMKNAHRSPDCKEYGDMTVAVDVPDGICQEYWYRSAIASHRDAFTRYWNQLSQGDLAPRHYDDPGTQDNCTVGTDAVLPRGNHHFRFVIAWNVPNCYNYWSPWKDAQGEDVLWKNYYATRFADSAATCRYALRHWNMLYRKTAAFTRSLHTATLDKAVIDAVSSTLSVLKTATVLRLEDGTFYGWEGLGDHEGSCEGTCTHVWSYAYTLCFLFPELERSLRDTELRYDTDEHGCMQFRTMLPLGRPRNNFYPCVDGQMATLFKVYRDWKLTGNGQWLKDNWPDLKKVLEFAWSDHNANAWDADQDGVLEGRQHHTLDRELYGPSAWLQGMYLAALKAAAQMAAFLDDTQAQEKYLELFEKGYAYTRDRLFNGRYYIQNVDLSDYSCIEALGDEKNWNNECAQLKYQIAEGCAIDQLLGQWHANLCGLGDIFDPAQRKIALKNMFANNFKPSMRTIANTWRVFALNDEAGAIMCDYPEDVTMPVIPLAYFQECMTGFEYAFAGLLISEGFLQEGLTVVRAIRDRYDGKKRNPYNEIECGSNYARAMASFALLPIFSGFTYDVPNRHVGFAPITQGDFKCFWGLGTGWGDFIRKGDTCRITISGGQLTLASVSLPGATVTRMYADGKEVPFTRDGDILRFPETTALREFRFEVRP